MRAGVAVLALVALLLAAVTAPGEWDTQGPSWRRRCRSVLG
jgi:hypothetical protein